MKKEIIVQLNKTFEESAYTQNGVEYWMARDVQKLLDYTEWRNFLLVIDKAKIACMNSGQNISDHFVDVNKTIPMPKGAEKDIQDIMLTRYAAIPTEGGALAHRPTRGALCPPIGKGAFYVKVQPIKNSAVRHAESLVCGSVTNGAKI